MIIIEVIYGSAKEQEFNYKKQSSGADIGDKGAFIRQHILVTGHTVNGFPATNARDATITLGIINKTKGGVVPTPYSVGKYVISDEGAYFDRDEINFTRVKLKPLAEYLAEVGDLIARHPELSKHLNPQKQAA